jgi:hypothetical protein
VSFCAEEEIRTPTAVTPLPPQSSASTNFATSAGWGAKIGERALRVKKFAADSQITRCYYQLILNREMTGQKANFFSILASYLIYYHG